MTPDERENAKQALRRVMEWHCSDPCCVGWSSQEEAQLRWGTDPDARAAQWLAGLAGGWWQWSEEDGDLVFVESLSLDKLRQTEERLRESKGHHER